MNALTRYAEDRARYDTTYIRGVYASVEAASSQFKLPSNTTWPGVSAALGDVRACLSIDANTTCKIQPDARDAFGDYASRVLAGRHGLDVVEAFSSEAGRTSGGSRTRSTQWRRSTTRSWNRTTSLT